jgi:hypothetical protein
MTQPATTTHNPYSLSRFQTTALECRIHCQTSTHQGRDFNRRQSFWYFSHLPFVYDGVFTKSSCAADSVVRGVGAVDGESGGIGVWTFVVKTFEAGPAGVETAAWDTDFCCKLVFFSSS